MWGLPLSQATRKYGKYRVEDYVRMAEALGIGKSKAKMVLKQTIEIYLDRFPAYIDKTVAFGTKHDLKIQDTRLGKKRFSAQLQSLYDRKLIQLKKQGVLQELGLLEKYGGALKDLVSDPKNSTVKPLNSDLAQRARVSMLV